MHTDAAFPAGAIVGYNFCMPYRPAWGGGATLTPMRAPAPATLPATDYTARMIPHCAGVAVPLEVDPILWQR